MTTTIPAVDSITRAYMHIDADGVVLGRLASRVAMVLRGKHKVTFSPHLDVGDFVIVTNAKKVKITGNKLTQKLYDSYSGYPSGLKQRTLGDMLRRHPERVIEHAVKGMLPPGPLGRKLLGKLKVYPDAHHPHEAQKPTTFSPVKATAGQKAS